jgi:hypothetical protein
MNANKAEKTRYYASCYLATKAKQDNYYCDNKSDLIHIIDNNLEKSPQRSRTLLDQSRLEE